MHKHFNLTLLMGAVALLAACGGGGGDPAPAAADMVPASATVSALAFSQYAGGLAEDDQREPLPVSDLAPPVDDTSEPAPVTR